MNNQYMVLMLKLPIKSYKSRTENGFFIRITEIIIRKFNILLNTTSFGIYLYMYHILTRAAFIENLILPFSNSRRLFICSLFSYKKLIKYSSSVNERVLHMIKYSWIK